jgi:6-phosphogluconolactonase/glucosamine-6-phosphate isomerase/deaminase
MKMTISKDIDELSSQFAQWLVAYINEVLSKQDRFTIALSGGNTPKKLYHLLASDNYKKQIDWAKLHFFWGDERYVPSDDERSNIKMAFESLLNHVPFVRRTSYKPILIRMILHQRMKKYCTPTLISSPAVSISFCLALEIMHTPFPYFPAIVR